MSVYTISLQLAHQPSLPIELHFSKKLKEAQMRQLLTDTLENMALSHGKSLKTVSITNITKNNSPQITLIETLKFSNSLILRIDMKLENMTNDQFTEQSLKIRTNDNQACGLPLFKIKTSQEMQIENKTHPLMKTSKLDIEPESLQTEDKILSTENATGQLSYLGSGIYTTSIYEKQAPPPIYLQKPYPNKIFTNSEDLLKGLQITDSGELKVTDKVVLNKFKGLMSEMMKKIASAISNGGGMVGVSLPVRIFEPRSALERISDLWGYSVNYLSKHLHFQHTLTLQQKTDNIGHVMAFALAGLSLSFSMYKPFNPLLGETYQGIFPDGTTLLVEHISHHPPISVFHIDNSKYTLQGHYEYKAKTSSTFNQVNIIYHGPNILTIKTNKQVIKYNMPEIKVSGMIWGDRLTKIVKSSTFVDEDNRIKGIIGFGCQLANNGKIIQKKTDSIYGQIYTYSSSTNKKKEEENMKMSDKIEQLREIKGSYLKQMLIDNNIIWDITRDVPEMVVPIENPLPSDWRFREDLIWLAYEQLGRSEKWKIKLEQEQRRHRKLRARYAKIKKL